MIAGNRYGSHPVLGLVDRAFDEGVGAEMGGCVDHMQPRNAGDGTGRVGVRGLPVEHDGDALAGLAAEFGGQVYERLPAHLQVAIEARTKFAGMVDDVVSVDIVMIYHVGMAHSFGRVWTAVAESRFGAVDSLDSGSDSGEHIVRDRLSPLREFGDSNFRSARRTKQGDFVPLGNAVDIGYIDDDLIHADHAGDRTAHSAHQDHPAVRKS